MPMRPTPSARRVVLLAGLACLLLAVRCGPPQPFDQELLANPGFEDGVLGPWAVEYGSCEVEHGPSFSRGNAHGGDYLFYGGDDGTVSSCRAAQDLDLRGLNFRVNSLDGEAVAVDGGAWLRSWLNAGTYGSFDDQIFYRVRFLDGALEELGSLRTLLVGDDDWLDRNLFGVLPSGTRHLRVELESRFRLGSENDGMADDTRMAITQVTPASPAITKLPMLHDTRQDAMTVMWETDGNLVSHSVEYGLGGGGFTHEETRVETTQVDATHFVHKAVLTGLSPETQYVYRVKSGTTTSITYDFTTAPLATSPFRVAWVSDNQNGPATLGQLASRMALRDPNLIIAPGDLVQNGSSLSEWQTFWWSPLETSFLGQTTPIMVARGNHDGEHFYSYAYTSVPGNESWYSFTYGNSFFVALDTEAPTFGTGGDEDPLLFLQNALDSPEALAAEFRIVYFHKPPYTNLWDATNILACFVGAEYDGEPDVRSDWVPVFEQKNVDLVVSGHTHSYQHGFQNGVHYLLVGGGGGDVDTIRGCGGSTFWNLIDTEASVHHYNVMDVDGNELSWAAYDTNDNLVHSFSIIH